MIILLFIIIYILTIFLYKMNYLIMASILMLAFSLFAYYYDVKKTNNMVNLRALYSVGFLGSFALSFLKLSNLTLDYGYKFFIVIFIAVVGFYFTYELSNKYHNFNLDNLKYQSKSKTKDYVYKVLLVTMGLSFVAFFIEVSVLKFIPLFVKNVPHAYSTFHIFMLHYITTFYIFVPSMAVLYYYYEYKANNINSIIMARVLIAILYAIAMATLLVSRGQLLMSVIMAFVTFAILFLYDTKFTFNSIIDYVKRHIKILIIIIISFGILYLIITIRRSHSISYLNDIFDMKNKDIPIFITQPYMYLTEGFENLNYMIEKLNGFGFGKRSFQPIFTFTFMNKLFYFDFMTELLLLKEELTNMTLFYDAYYDFKYIGVLVLTFVLGLVSSYLDNYIKVYKKSQDSGNSKNPIGLLFYALMGYYMIMSFFQPFFSLTSSFVYIMYILILYIVFYKV